MLSEFVAKNRTEIVARARARVAKRAAPSPTAEELDATLNFRDVPARPAEAIRGLGVLETLRAASELVLRGLSRRNVPTAG